MGLIAWMKGLFQKAGSLFSKLWNIAKPFLQQILSSSAQAVWSSLQDLAVQAVAYVATQGLPDDEAKRKAFEEFMLKAAKDKVEQLKDSEFNLLREIALAIFKKSQGLT